MKKLCKNITSMTTLIEEDLSFTKKNIGQIISYVYKNNNSIDNVCITVDNNEQSKLISTPEFIDFISKFGYSICFEYLQKPARNLPQNSFFCFCLNKLSLSFIREHYQVIEKAISPPYDIYFRNNKECLMAIIGYGGLEYEAEGVLVKGV